MEIEFLHNLHGDKKRVFDSSTTEGRKLLAQAVNSSIKKGTAIFLERGKETYVVIGYDPERDRLQVRVEGKNKKSKTVGAKPTKGRATAVAPVAGG